MPYSNVNQVPKSLKIAGLTLPQANDWARYYDAAKKSDNTISPAAIAWTRFKKKYYKVGGSWKLKKTNAENKIIKELSDSLDGSYKKENVIFNPLFNEEIKNKIKTKQEDFMSEIKGYELVYRESSVPTSLEDATAEGKLYEKELIREGEWAHPQNSSVKLNITANRMKKWIENFNKNMFKVPVPKRHSLDPEDNRGWVKSLELRENEDGKFVLFGKLDITNGKMQELIDNGDIQDVSVSIGRYIDNKGNKHGETLQHVALTVIPHIDSQSGFTPVNAEGYLCLEEVGEIQTIEDRKEAINNQAPTGSDEEKKEDLLKAIVTARIFPEPKSLYIVGTYKDRVILQYYGGGAGDDGEPTPDRFFEIPYAMDLKGNYVFGDKVELAKEYYFVKKEMVKEPSVAAEEKQNKEVNEMAELEKMMEEKVKLEQEKADLEAKVSEMEPKIAELEAKKTELEESNKAMKEELDKIEAEKKAAFEKGVEEKVEKYIEKGNISPAEKDDVKAVLLEGGKASEVLEKTLENRKAVDLETNSKQKSEKPKEGGEMTDAEAEAEAERISNGK